MTLKEKIIKIASLTLCAAVVTAGCVFGARAYKKNHIKYTVADTLEDGGGREATVILIGGQSNASGCSLNEYLERNVSEEKYAEYKSGPDNVYINHLSVENASGGFVKCVPGQGETDEMFGLELGLAEKLHELYPERTFFIIKCAWGNTDLFEKWLSPSSEGETGVLYKHFVEFVETNLEYLESKNYKINVAAMCWMQGESDSFEIANSENYGERTANLVNDLRGEFDEYNNGEGILFVDAYIAENPMYWVYDEGVNRGKAEVAASSPLNVIVETSHLITTNEPEDNPDVPHYDSMSEIELGHLFAEKIAAFIG